MELNKGSWDDDHQGNTGWEKQEDGSYTTTDGWANIKYTFEGTYFALVGTKGPDYGSFDIYIDGKYTSSANASAGEITPGQILYESPTLGAGTHTIQLTTGTNRKPVNFAYGYYLGTNENGLFEIETDSYQVTEGDSIKVKIKRNGDQQEKLLLMLQHLQVQQYKGNIMKILQMKQSHSKMEKK